MTREVVNDVIYRNNPYHALIYRGIEDRYVAVAGTVDDAIARQGAGGAPQLLHLHWEENALRGLRTDAEARLAVARLLERLNALRAAGGRIVWTVHNELPHEGAHVDAFLALRRGLMARSDAIIVHNLRAIEVLAAQGTPPIDRVRLMPHPSYRGVFAPSAAPDWTSRTILLFGMARRYKGIDAFLRAFVASGAAERRMRARVVGEPLGGDDYGRELERAFGGADGVDLEIRRPSDEDAAQIMAESACLMLPYPRFLTSGAAMAAMTVGLPVIGPDVPQLREALPGENHRFLFQPEDLADALARVDALLAVSRAERIQLRTALIARAEHLEPARISQDLARLYDAVSAAPARE